MSTFIDLEKLIQDEANLIDLASVYPNEIRKWIALQRRNGKYCPLSRGVLKMIMYYEKDNAVFNEMLKNGAWDQSWKTKRKNS